MGKPLVNRTQGFGQEAGLLPIVVEHVWNLNPILDENGSVGAFLKALFGYNGNPSLLEVTAYWVYLVGIGALSLREMRKSVPVLSTPTQPQPECC